MATDNAFFHRGPHPLLLQIAGFHAVELTRRRGGSLGDRDRPELQQHFESRVITPN